MASGGVWASGGLAKGQTEDNKHREHTYEAPEPERCRLASSLAAGFENPHG
jgi:hypothetical protein